MISALMAIAAGIHKFRKQFICLLLIFTALFGVFFWLSDNIINKLSHYIYPYRLMAITPAEALFAKVILTLFLSGVFLIPFFIFILYLLKDRNRKKAAVTAMISISLAVLSCLFSTQVMLQNTIAFLMGLLPDNIIPAISVLSYVKFTGAVILVSALTFQMPLIISALYSWGAINAQRLAGARKYIIVGAFIVSAVLTPPDALSMVLAALPILILYEGSICVLKIRAYLK